MNDRDFMDIVKELILHYEEKRDIYYYYAFDEDDIEYSRDNYDKKYISLEKILDKLVY